MNGCNNSCKYFSARNIYDSADATFENHFSECNVPDSELPITHEKFADIDNSCDGSPSMIIDNIARKEPLHISHREISNDSLALTPSIQWEFGSNVISTSVDCNVSDVVTTTKNTVDVSVGDSNSNIKSDCHESDSDTISCDGDSLLSSNIFFQQRDDGTIVDGDLLQQVLSFCKSNPLPEFSKVTDIVNVDINHIPTKLHGEMLLFDDGDCHENVKDVITDFMLKKI